MNPAIIFKHLTVNLSQLMNVQCTRLRPQSLVLAATVSSGLITLLVFNFMDTWMLISQISWDSTCILWGFHFTISRFRQVMTKDIKFHDSNIFDFTLFFETLNFLKFLNILDIQMKMIPWFSTPSLQNNWHCFTTEDIKWNLPVKPVKSLQRICQIFIHINHFFCDSNFLYGCSVLQGLYLHVFNFAIYLQSWKSWNY